MLLAVAAGCGAKTELEAEPRRVRLMSTGHHQTCVVDDRDDVWCWGIVGGEPEFIARPVTRVGNLAHIEQLAVMGGTVCARTGAGVVLCSGNNELSQLGEAGPDRRAFGAVAGLGPTVQIAAVGARVCALSAEGVVRCWGSRGALIDGTFRPLVFAPTVVALREPIASLHTMPRFCATGRSGTLYCENPYADETRDVVLPIRAFEIVGAGAPLMTGGQVCLRDGSTIRCEADSMANGRLEFNGVSEAMTEVFFIEGGLCGLIQGRLLCQGGQRDLRRPASRPSRLESWDEADLPLLREVHPGTHAVCAVDLQGRPLCWGDDSFAQLGQGLPRYTHVATRVELSEPARAVEFDTVNGDERIDVGYEHRWARRENLRSDIDDERRARERSAWSPFASRFASERTMLEWRGPLQQLTASAVTGCARVEGERTQCASMLRPAWEPFGDDAGDTVMIDGADELCRIRADRRVECTSSTSLAGAARVLAFEDARSIAVGDRRICAVSGDRVARCVGEAPLGDRTMNGSATPVVVARDVEAIEQHGLVTCVTDAQSRRSCWGRGAQWLFDLRSNETVTEPRRIDFDRPMRAFAPSSASLVMCALTDDRAVFCRGLNSMSQCGQPATRREVGWSRVEGLTDVRALSMGFGQSCAIDGAGGVWCWGATTGRFESFGHVPHSERALYVTLVER
ncbi:MAG: hypothetical protein U0269_13580 [Polyangiales bacterium]